MRLEPTLRQTRWIRAAIAIAAAPLLALIAWAAVTPLPPELNAPHAFDSSIRVFDRNGKVLAEVRADDGARARWVHLEEIGPYLARAMVAAEDQRFYVHPGIDLAAIARAAAQDLWNRRIVSGASTLTQQLARNLVPRPRTLPGKLFEMAVALRIEASLSKRQILESYLNLVHFGPSLRGAEAASRFYFDKPCSALSLSEAATLAALPRAPAMYDPRKAPESLVARRDRILGRMLAAGWASDDEVARAKREPVTVHLRATGWGAPHLIRALLAGQVQPGLGPLQDRVSVLATTIDSRLQREAQTAARDLVSSLAARHVTAASVIVIDNASSDILAWVGAPDFSDEQRLGQNDGVLALRQPGSALKPFVYSAAIDDLGWNGATLLPDVELHLAGETGSYSPQNYDGRFHGPVRLREALGNSFNVPAVVAASAVGPARVLQRLRDVGLTSLDKPADFYGAAIALGDGEVRLLDLANAYATLARGGMSKPIRALQSATGVRGEPIQLPHSDAARRVMPETTARLLLDILSDPDARLSSFGAGSVLDLPFPVAVKTGTSKGFRDNWAVGSSSEVTVGVWVGNFDGSAMQGTSGITGAGPLFRTVMIAAMQARQPRPLRAEGAGFERVSICALSGKRATARCPHRVDEPFARGHAPEQECDMHVAVQIDRRNGLLAGPGCPPGEVTTRVFERYEPGTAAWAREVGRPVTPEAWSPLCPGQGTPWDMSRDAISARPTIRYPVDGASFLLDPAVPAAQQAIVVHATAPAGATSLSFLVDGAVVATRQSPFEYTLRLTPGRHELVVSAPDGSRSNAASFVVE